MDNLEKYYRGDDDWLKIAYLYKDLPNSENTFLLKNILGDKDDLLLTKVIEGKLGEVAVEWTKRSIPALDNLRPMDCVKSPELLKRLKTMLMRM